VTKNITINKNVNVNQNTNVNRNDNTNVNRNGSSRPGTYVNKYGGPRQETPGRGPMRLAGGPRGGDVIRQHRIPEQRFHSNFGRGHEFHLRRSTLIGSAPIFHYGGIGFRMGRPWPATWLETDPLYVDAVGGAYYLCNRLRPEARVLVNVAECDTCQVVEAPAPCDNCGPVEAAPAPECTECARQVAGPDAPPTLTRGMTIGQVVAVLGNPKEIVDLGVRKIYLYDNMRVTFFGGRMSDVR
jgi:hypothetical protein